MAMVATTPTTKAAYVAEQPPPGFQQKTRTTASAAPPTGEHDHQVLHGIVLALRSGAALVAFLAVALVASCRHGGWMEFARYQEYRYLLGASVVACVYSAAQALRNFRRMRAAYGTSSGSLLDFAGDQVVAYLLITASSAALPITVRMRSAVINIFTDAMAAAISLGFIAFAALALSAMLSGFRLSARAY